MNDRPILHADAGPWRYKIEFANGLWKWEIFEGLKGMIASGDAFTLDRAKSSIATETGRAPDDGWKSMEPD
jgi:hypothetical protein